MPKARPLTITVSATRSASSPISRSAICCPYGVIRLRADHRKRRLAERFRGTQNIQHMRVVGGFAQQGRVLCVGGGDDLDPVFAAMFDFALCVCERFLLEDRPREFRSESGFFDEFVGRSGENRLCRTEYVEQMDRPFRAYSRREGKGYVWNFALHFPYPAIPE